MYVSHLSNNPVNNQYDNSVKHVNNRSHSAATKATTDNSVQLSAAGTLAAGSDTPTGLWAMRLPSWSMDFQPTVMDLSYSADAIKESKASMEMAEKLRANGKISSQERQTMQDFLQNNMPVTQQRKAAEAFYAQHITQFDQLASIRTDYIEEAKQEFGIHSQADLREVLASNSEIEEKIRTRIQEKMLSDPNAVALIEKLKV